MGHSVADSECLFIWAVLCFLSCNIKLVLYIIKLGSRWGKVGFMDFHAFSSASILKILLLKTHRLQKYFSFQGWWLVCGYTPKVTYLVGSPFLRYVFSIFNFSQWRMRSLWCIKSNLFKKDMFITISFQLCWIQTVFFLLGLTCTLN